VSVSSLEGGSIIAILLTQVVMRVFENRKNNNGGNPVVRAIGTLRDSLEREQRLTQEKLQHLVDATGAHNEIMRDQHERTQKVIADCSAQTDKRLSEHEAREERKWDSVDAKLGGR
jgi:hypothetical protein